MSEVSSKEMYEVKKTLKELEDKKGRGTELVSVYIPHDKQVSDVRKQMVDEIGQSSNIKSKQTRKNVQSAIEVIIQRLKLFPQPPEKGLVMFVGMIPKGGPGTEKMETYVFEPPEPVQTYIYHCDSQFFLDPLKQIIEYKEVYGVLVLDRKEATIATLRGKRIDIVKTLTSGVPGKHKAGGQSQRRFDRVIEDEAHKFLKRIGQHSNDTFLPIDDELKGVLIGGPGHTKNDFEEGDYLDYRIKDKIINIVDTSYTGDFGIREVIDESTDALEEMDIMREKKLMKKFLSGLISENGLSTYGEKQVRQNLQMGAVETLLLSENLKTNRQTYQCPSCGTIEVITTRQHQEAPDKQCPNCNDKMNITKTQETTEEFIELAEEVATQVEIISIETEEGTQLDRAFGGIAGILRYKV
ncbi:MAG: peptide chain release factor aRF-1 [Methanosphaera sp.]|uniref:peptide chain release factor aRF-1 n=1 Tax=Methanosphaera sp. BMS TaxID=1789762 RepID=UPI000DC1BEE2|nr:peptide chain release factor aRF-1 [Methanosphaera sp. BMS]AWX33162.1 peptide chain release factor 1 [Methanosphaera sp. BMS]MBQ2635610.1 peptide chain release factor aRF-1 [Methanobrevibacter sp.]MBQ6444014.1 peptide chain release factor aRF-1 [Methanosphaera sp.]